jgi:hypothetical protein
MYRETVIAERWRRHFVGDLVMGRRNMRKGGRGVGWGGINFGEVLSDCVIEASGLPYRKCRIGAEIAKTSSFSSEGPIHTHAL